MSYCRSSGPQPVHRSDRFDDRQYLGPSTTAVGSTANPPQTAYVSVYTPEIGNLDGPFTLVAQWPLTSHQHVRQSWAADPQGVSLNQIEMDGNRVIVRTCASATNTIVAIENIPAGYEEYTEFIGGEIDPVWVWGFRPLGD